MFARFTERARKVMSLARHEAQRLRHEAIGSEHILFGILQEGGGVAAKVLQNSNVDYKRVRQEIERQFPAATPEMVILGQLPFSPLAKRTFELAIETADQLGHDSVGTEHLLLGILRSYEGIAASVLTGLNLNFEAARDMVLQVLATDVSRHEPPPAPSPVLVERNLFDRAQGYLALADRPAIQEAVAGLLQQGRSVALVGPPLVGKTSLVLALSRAKAGSFTYWSIDYRIFDESHVADFLLPKRPGTVCFVPEGELVTASRSHAADVLDERRRGGERLILEFRDGGFEAYAARHPDLAKELVPVPVPAPDAVECREQLSSLRPQLKTKMGLDVADDVLQEADKLARTRWPRMVAPWPTLIALWKAAAIQNESAARGDLQRLEKDIKQLENSPDPQDRSHAAALRNHMEGLRGLGGGLTLESIRQAIGELADRPAAAWRSSTTSGSSPNSI